MDAVAAGKPSYARDLVYGAIDGVVTTFAVVAGAAGANLRPGVAIVLGFANQVADGFSMGVSNYLGTHTEYQRRLRLIRRQEQRIANDTAGEREALRRIFSKKGFPGSALDEVVMTISADRDLWVQTMLNEEHGLGREARSPLSAGVATLLAFIVAGLMPLAPYVVAAFATPAQPPSFVASAAASVFAFALIGTLRGRFAGGRWWASAVQTTLIGVVAAGLAYMAGMILGGLA